MAARLPAEAPVGAVVAGHGLEQVVAAVRRRLVKSPVEVRLKGGALDIEWEPGGTIRMSGPATHVFTGELGS